MALIYRSIFDVADTRGGFVDRAARCFEEWIRVKLHDSAFELPRTGKVERRADGIEITSAHAEADGLSVFRGALFETARADGAELETQLIAIQVREISIARSPIDAAACVRTICARCSSISPAATSRPARRAAVWKRSFRVPSTDARTKSARPSSAAFP